MGRNCLGGPNFLPNPLGVPVLLYPVFLPSLSRHSVAAIFLPGLGRVKFDSRILALSTTLCIPVHPDPPQARGASQAHRFCMTPPRGGGSQEKQQREPRLGVGLGKERWSLGQSFHFLRPRRLWVVVSYQ